MEQGDIITNGVFQARLEETPKLKADITWLHNDVTQRNADLSEFNLEQTFTKEDLQEAFKAGISFEHGEQESWKTYNKFTGNQQPNKELNFEEWFNKFKK